MVSYKALALLLILSFSMQLYAEPQINKQITRYSVFGITAPEIRKDMNRKRPTYDGLRKFDAYTKWWVNWDFWWETSSGKCRINRVETTVDVEMVLPELADKESLSADVLYRWESYIKALAEHEYGYMNYGVRTAKDIERDLKRMSAKHCDDLEKKANKKANAILNRYIRLEKAYDRNTKHGMKDGAVFP